MDQRLCLLIEKHEDTKNYLPFLLQNYKYEIFDK